jgi:hypothetical protein
MNIMAKEMKDMQSNPLKLINENMRGCDQKYVYEELESFFVSLSQFWGLEEAAYMVLGL